MTLLTGLACPIPLGVSRSEISNRNPQVTTVPPKGLTIKLQVVVRDKGMKDPKLSYNILPKKFLGIHILMLANGSVSTYLVK